MGRIFPRQPKVCERCGEKFLGGHSSKYCYTCRDILLRIKWNANRKRRRLRQKDTVAK